MKKYDIFISYRRDDGGQYARILQLELEKLHYKVFLDYEELTDGIFGEEIIEAIQSAPIFIMVLTPLYLARTMENDSWVTKEIRMAIESHKHFIPVDPDRKFNGIPENAPNDIKDIVGNHQHSSIDFGQALGPTVNLMVQNRIIPHVPLPQKRSKRRIILIATAIVAVLIGSFFYLRHYQKAKITALMMECEALVAEKGVDVVCQQQVNWNPNITYKQLQAVESILENMIEVQGGTFLQGADPNQDPSLVCPELETPQHEQSVESFFMGKYEVSIAEWCGIMNQKHKEEEALMPITNLSFEECNAFTSMLDDLTGLDFNLPTEAEWEYAARGGNHHDGTSFAGSDRPDQVAWYGTIANGRPHSCDASNISITCNSLDLYDMSGNVSEWCNTRFQPYDSSVSVPNPNAIICRGGYYDSEPYELTVYHRDFMAPTEKTPYTGLRLVISKSKQP